MKKVLCSLIICIVLATGWFVYANSNEYIQALKVMYPIKVNGEKITNEMTMYNINDRVYLPLRTIADILGIGIEWNEEESTVEIMTDSTTEPGINLNIDKETAIKIGKAILEEYFPDDFSEIDMNITADEKDGIWKVYNNVDRETEISGEKIGAIKGGELYVLLRKDNGEIIKIGVND